MVFLFCLGTPQQGVFGDDDQLNPVSSLFPCRTCNIVFSSFDDLATHDRRCHHIGTDAWHCRVCMVDCHNPVQLKGHLVKVHGQEFKHLCFECGRGFKSYSSFNTHNRLFHRADLNCPVCPICRRVFPFDSKLQVHLKRHSDDQPYFCRVCGKTYKYEWNLKVHNCVHSQGSS